VALDATLRAVVGLGTMRLPVSSQALRYKLLKHKQGTLFVFAIDASGSMAANRIARAKSTILKLLRRSYLNRDSVAIVSFHGTTANVDLPPSRSILRARRVLDSLRMGGSTPLGLGLVTTIELRDGCVAVYGWTLECSAETRRAQLACVSTGED
jgi:magnesium chelatase subunit D